MVVSAGRGVSSDLRVVWTAGFEEIHEGRRPIFYRGRRLYNFSGNSA